MTEAWGTAPLPIGPIGIVITEVAAEFGITIAGILSKERCRARCVATLNRAGYSFEPKISE